MNIIDRIRGVSTMCSSCSSLKSDILDTNKTYGTIDAIQAGLAYDGSMCGSAQKIVRLCREANEKEMQSAGPVCDRILRCYGWEKNYRDGRYDDFKFCPWCGKKLTWIVQTSYTHEYNQKKNKSKVVNLGWTNGWSETPKIVKECRISNHKTEEIALQSFVHEVRCDICGYKYKYDKE